MKKAFPILLILALLLGGCGEKAPGSTDPTVVTQAASVVTVPDTAFTDRELSGDYDAANATSITLSGSEAAISGSGAEVTGSGVTITDEGTYLLSGSGSSLITVAAGDSDKVQLVLNGVSITNEQGPAIYIQSADKVFLTLASGNTVSDGSGYTFTDGDTTVDAAIFSRADLTINGSGSLTVFGNCKHGIVSKDDLVVTGGTLEVTAQNVGLNGKDCVKLCGSTIQITAGSDGIRSDNNEDAERGYVYIESGSLSITAGNDGIQAETALQIDGGEISISAGGGSSGIPSDTESTKGLKAETALSVSGGTIAVSSSDDCVHSNGSVAITGGSFTLSTGSKGIHADAELSVTGGDIAIPQSYEGMEASSLLIAGGNIHIVSSDDGLNASSSDSANGAVGFFGRGGENDGSQIVISGGYLLIDAQGDGIDSNGSLTISGGVTLVSGPTNSGNSALDYGSSATVTGGVCIALGSTGVMVQGFSSAENQGAILYSLTPQEAGTSLALCDSQGTVVASFTPAKAYSSVAITAPGIQSGGSYTIVTGGTIAGADANGYAENAAITGGTTAASLEMTANLYNAGGGIASGKGGFQNESKMNGGSGEMPGASDGSGEQSRDNRQNGTPSEGFGQKPADQQLPGNNRV